MLKTSGDSLGRTWIDVVHLNRFVIMMALIVLSFLLLYVFFPLPISTLLTSISEFIVHYAVYLIPIVSGIYAGFHVYKKYITSGVILLVEPLDSPSYCVRMSRSYFARFTTSNGIVNPESTKFGESLYRIRSLDIDSMTMDVGWIHDRESSPSLILAVKSNYYGFMDKFREASERVVELTDAPFIQGTELGLKFVKRNLDLQDKILFGKVDEPSEKTEVPSEGDIPE